MLILYVLTLFLSAGLLFLVQPMFAKMVLPLLGGTPMVWNTCMVFFQGALLAGYAYAHLSTKFLGVKKSAIVHGVLLLLPLLVLPLVVPEGWTPPAEGNPFGWLLLLLSVAIGLPFFVVASTAPLLQKWFSTTGHRTAHDPYFLYAASNCGSMLALLAYPALMEPTLKLGDQSLVWSGGYFVLVILIWGCAIMLTRTKGIMIETPSEPESETELANEQDKERLGKVTWMRRGRWIALAAVPSSLMLGVTTYITTDIAVVPLLWIIPLVLYLLTFILVFAKKQLLSHRWMVRFLPIACIALLIVLLSEGTEPVMLVVLLHLSVFFIMTMSCHGELARDRPATSHLTEFYLFMSVGGVLGGLFNAMVAPMVFTSIAEYPIALVVACLLIPSSRKFFESDGEDEHASPWTRRLDYVFPLLLGGIALAMVWWANDHAEPGSKARLIFTAGIPAVVCYFFSMRPIRFGLALGAVFLAGSFDTVTRGQELDAQRSFFGVHRLTREYRIAQSGLKRLGINQLFHGTTLHGMQYVGDDGQPILADTPLTYYHRLGPIGQVFGDFRVNDADPFTRVGIVGLGGGGLFAYADEGDHFTVYEIDPEVESIATNPTYFSYFEKAKERNANVNIVLGDARLTLDKVEADTFDLLVLDAFSSDSIPVHLLTKEAASMYIDTLKPNGLLAFHISNRYLDLKPIMGNLAQSLGLVCFVQHDVVSDGQENTQPHSSSIWIVMARSVEDLMPLHPDSTRSKWERAPIDPELQVWTDDYSNILGVFNWGFNNPDSAR
ncbi:MAG: fused MFS/spermidine synthase [Planctomycetota bacterium]|nr:fused MFS/spermidine synthase [Planctomycetota bacterium]